MNGKSTMLQLSGLFSADIKSLQQLTLSSQ
jgi:hypothetical protein